jgi:CHASE2 domain-containing sensor protein
MIGSVDSEALLELLWAAPLAALTVTIAWGLVIHGSARAVEARRDGRTGLAIVHASTAVVGAALFISAVVFGLIVMTSKE